MADEICLRYDNYNRALMDRFVKLFESETLVDCTIASEGHHLKAHKVVLAASSLYFESLFKDVVESHITVVLHGITLKNLKCILDFIYHGKVSISRRQLAEFVKCAGTLQILGLIINEGPEDGNHSETVIETRAEEVREEDIKIQDYGPCSDTTVRIERTPRPAETQSGQAHASNTGAAPAAAARASPSPTPAAFSANTVLTVVSVHAPPSCPTPDPTPPATLEPPPSPPPPPAADPQSQSAVFKYPTVHLKRFDDTRVSRRVKRKSFAGSSISTPAQTATHPAPSDAPSSSTQFPSSAPAADIETLCNDTIASAEGPDLDISASYGCMICSESFPSWTAAANHIKSHSGETPYKCTLCDTGFVEHWLLRRHQLAEHGDEPLFKCTVCGRGFRRRTTLRKHRMVHAREGRPAPAEREASADQSSDPHASGPQGKCGPRFTCGTCGRGFSRRWYLQQHMVVHSNLRQHACKYCDRSFLLPANLQRHMRIHVPQAQLRCPDCDEAFASNQTLRVHMRLHEGGRPFFCETCGKGFRSAMSLKLHSRSHSEEAPYECSLCPRAFALSSALARHTSRIHRKKPE